MGGLPPISRVRLPGGRSRFTFWRPDEPSGNLKSSAFTIIDGAGGEEVIARGWNL